MSFRALCQQGVGPNLTLRLFGQFRIETADGEELTPRGAKSQALLALLAVEPRHRRSRAWLQDKLWSDRSPSHGAASLRQALVEIRRALGPHADALHADRRVVALDASRVAVEARSSDTDEFLEGLDIRDPEFEDWLRSMRSRAADGQPVVPVAAGPPIRNAPRPRPERKVLLLPVTEEPGLLRLIENQFVDVAARSIRETFSLDIQIREPGQPEPGMLTVSVQAFELRGTHLGIRIVLEDVDDHRALWSETVATPHAPGPISQSIDHMGLCHRLMSALSDALVAERERATSDPDANWLAAQALRKMFSMRHGALGEADRMLALATDISPRGVFNAWRAQLAVIQFVEREGHSKVELRERAEEHAARAIAAEPMNSNVLSCLANARLVLDGNLAASGELAKLGVEVNPANPLAWRALANAKLYGDDAAGARDAARIAQRLAENSPLRFRADCQVALIAAVTGRPDEAIANAEISSALAPCFRPPLRYLAALHAARGNREAAARAVRRLAGLERDFSPERLSSDPDYPVSMMRRAGLIDASRLSDLGG